MFVPKRYAKYNITRTLKSTEEVRDRSNPSETHQNWVCLNSGTVTQPGEGGQSLI